MAKKKRQYQTLIDEGKSARRTQDHLAFLLGRLALELDVIEGNHTIEEFAKDIQVGRSTLFEYRQVVNFYPENIIEAFLEPEDSPLTYTHFRDAMRGRDLTQAVALLEKWWDDLATPDEADFQVGIGHGDGEWSKVAECTASGRTAYEEFSAWLNELRDTLRLNVPVRMAIYKEKQK